jgi:hypothetical protein
MYLSHFLLSSLKPWIIWNGIISNMQFPLLSTRELLQLENYITYRYTHIHSHKPSQITQPTRPVRRTSWFTNIWLLSQASQRVKLEISTYRWVRIEVVMQWDMSNLKCDVNIGNHYDEHRHRHHHHTGLSKKLATCSSIKSSWLRHCATIRKVAGSSLDEVIGFFNLPNPSRRIMTLGSTQPLTEMSTRNLSGV